MARERTLPDVAPPRAPRSELVAPGIDVDAEWLEETDDLFTPMGSRGIGEIGIVGTAAAVLNATYHATGIRRRAIPLTPDQFLQPPEA